MCLTRTTLTLISMISRVHLLLASLHHECKRRLIITPIMSDLCAIKVAARLTSPLRVKSPLGRPLLLVVRLVLPPLKSVSGPDDKSVRRCYICSSTSHLAKFHNKYGVTTGARNASFNNSSGHMPRYGRTWLPRGGQSMLLAPL